MNTETPLPIITAADRREAQWHARCAEFETFVDEHGRRPNGSDASSLNFLSGWVRSNVTASTRGTMSPSRLARFSAVLARCTTIRTATPSRISKIRSLAGFVTLHERLPSSASTDPEEKSLNRYLVGVLRPDIRKGLAHPDSVALAKKIPGVVVAPGSQAGSSRMTKLRALAAFVKSAGRLPKISSKDVKEQALAKFLIHSLRPDIRKGTIHHEALAMAQTIPDVTAIQTQPTSAERLAETRRFLQEHGRRPRYVATDVPKVEGALAAWLSRHTSTGGSGTSAASLTLYREVDELIAAYPSASELHQVKRLDKLEEFILLHGHLPAKQNKSTPELAAQNSLATWLRYTAKAEMDEGMRRRLAVAMTSPSREAFVWRKKFSEVADLGGDLENGSGPWFWHQSQKFAYATGTLLPWQIEMLSEIPGGLPHPVAAAGF